MKISKVYYVILLFTYTQVIISQNLLNTNAWTVGSGNVAGFYSNGSASENIRELGKNHIGKNAILWKAIPDASSNADGGWNSSYLTIDNTKKYRLSVWIKKTNSNSGTTYFGCNSHNGSYQIYGLNGSLYTNPYFYNGDLPKLNQWYLLVGYVHEYSYTGTTKLGGIYDGVTGEKISDIHREFKFGTTANDLMHRSYLYYDTNTSDRQYFYAPRMEQVNSNMPTINELLKINPNSQLTFTYDTAGNQIKRFYCPDACSSNSSKTANEKETNIIAESVEPEIDNFKEQLFIFPNPTDGIVLIKMETALLKRMYSMNIYSSNSSLVKTLKVSSKNLQVDLTDMPSGVYFLHIHMTDGSNSITKKIIKK